MVTYGNSIHEKPDTDHHSRSHGRSHFLDVSTFRHLSQVMWIFTASRQGTWLRKNASRCFNMFQLDATGQKFIEIHCHRKGLHTKSWSPHNIDDLRCRALDLHNSLQESPQKKTGFWSCDDCRPGSSATGPTLLLTEPMTRSCWRRQRSAEWFRIQSSHGKSLRFPKVPRSPLFPEKSVRNWSSVRFCRDMATVSRCFECFCICPLAQRVAADKLAMKMLLLEAKAGGSRDGPKIKEKTYENIKISQDITRYHKVDLGIWIDVQSQRVFNSNLVTWRTRPATV